MPACLAGISTSVCAPMLTPPPSPSPPTHRTMHTWTGTGYHTGFFPTQRYLQGMGESEGQWVLGWHIVGERGCKGQPHLSLSWESGCCCNVRHKFTQPSFLRGFGSWKYLSPPCSVLIPCLGKGFFFLKWSFHALVGRVEERECCLH